MSEKAEVALGCGFAILMFGLDRGFVHRAAEYLGEKLRPLCAVK